MEKIGIENLKKVIDLALQLEDMISPLVKKDKDMSRDLPAALMKLPMLFSSIQQVAAAGKAIPAEIKDLDAQEAKELISYVEKKLTLDNAKAQAVVKACLKLIGNAVADGMDLYSAIRQPAA